MATSDDGLARPRGVTPRAVSPRRRMGFARYMRELGWRHIVGGLAVAFGLFPMVWVVMSSINTVDTLTTVELIPERTTLENFRELFADCTWSLGVPPFECTGNTPFPLWLWNSVKIAIIASVLQLVMSAFAAYSFARLRWRGRRSGLIGILLIQMFPQFLAFVAIFGLLDSLEETFGTAVQIELWVAMIPLAVLAIGVAYLASRSEWSSTARRWAYGFVGVVALIGVGSFIAPEYGITVFPKVGLGTHTGLVLVYLGGAVGVNTWLIKGFMDSIPMSLDEAAKVDGATEWDVFTKIVFPLTRPILIVIFILTFVGLYNEFILAQVLVRDVQQFTYATGLALFVESEYSAKWGQLSAAAVIGTVPILIIFWSLQDRIVGGLSGAVKG